MLADKTGFSSLQIGKVDYERGGIVKNDLDFTYLVRHNNFFDIWPEKSIFLWPE